MSSATVACYGYNLGRVIFISKENQRGYSLHYFDTQQTAVYSSLLSDIKGYPENAAFNGVCAYDHTSSSILLVFESSNSSIGQSDSNAAQRTVSSAFFRLGLNSMAPVIINETDYLPDTQVISAVNMGSANTTYIAFLSNGLHGADDISLNTLLLGTADMMVNKLMSVNQTGILAADVESQSVYLLQNGLVSEYRLKSLDYSTFRAFSSVSSVVAINTVSSTSVVSSSDNQTKYITYYDKQSNQVNIYIHNPSLTQYTPLYNNPASTFSLTQTSTVSSSTVKSTNTATPTKPSRPSLHRQQFAKTTQPASNDTVHWTDNAVKRDIPMDWAIQRIPITISGQEGCSLGQCILSVVAVPGTDQQLPINLISIIDKGSDGIGVYNNSEAFTQPPAPTSTEVVGVSHSEKNVPGGVIAGIVVGVVAFVFIGIGIFLYLRAKKLRRFGSFTSRSLQIEKKLEEEPVFIGEDLMQTAAANTRMTMQYNKFSSDSVTMIATTDTMTTTATTAIAAAAMSSSTTVLESHGFNDGRPDIRPVSYVEGVVDFAHLSEEEMLELEPERDGPMMLFNGAYKSLPEEQVIYYGQEGYATRTFMTDDGRYCTVHYFGATRLDTFIRSVYAVSSMEDCPFIMKSKRAVVLNSPTPRYGYQFLWITSPIIPSLSLHHLMFENVWSPVDHQDGDKRVSTTFALLCAVNAVHTHKFVHLAIDPTTFYYESSVSDWTLGNFAYVQKQESLITKHGLPKQPTVFTPPEFLSDKSFLYKPVPEADTWSLGCVIYTIATNGLLLFDSVSDIQNLMATDGPILQTYIDKSIEENISNQDFRVLLNGMLQVSPKSRKSIQFALDYWRGKYSLE
ncbi:hypothetical protein RMATCC62417_13510 [Rhizopus microsporus]|nr:hypothetical protein RMATCC62417_13510 [Rhizopus microsporus]